MAKGDIWIMDGAEMLHIRSGPGTNHASRGFLEPNDKVTEISSVTDNYYHWIEHDKGWSAASYGNRSYMHLVTVNPDGTTVTTIDGNVPLTEQERFDLEGYGYQPDTNDILSGNGRNVSNSEFSQIKNVVGVFGLPYQFLPTADPRLEKPMESGYIGYEYADKIITRIPLLFLAPGKASFMTKYSKENKKNILERLIAKGASLGSGNMEDLLNSDGRYYTFEYDSKRYYRFVNPMCRIAAKYLGIDDVRLIGADGERLGNLNWEEYTKSGIKSIGDFGTYTSVPFYIDTDTSINENFGNNTTDSMLASSINSASEMGRELNFLLGAGKANGLDFISASPELADNIENLNDTIKSLLGHGNFLSNIATHLTTVASGGKLIFPEIWADSQFSRSYSCEIKLISPDPSNLSIYLNILVPLFHLIALVAPQSLQSNPNGYTNPFLIRAIYKGFFNIDMGIITGMSVSKGAECQWTPEGLPTSVNVSIDIKDLYEALTITETTSSIFKYDTLNNTALMDYIANMCGINIYKPEVTRIIEMWFVNNFTNRVDDFFKLDIWGGIQQKVQNSIMNIFR